MNDLDDSAHLPRALAWKGVDEDRIIGTAPSTLAGPSRCRINGPGAELCGHLLRQERKEARGFWLWSSLAPTTSASLFRSRLCVDSFIQVSPASWCAAWVTVPQRLSLPGTSTWARSRGFLLSLVAVGSRPARLVLPLRWSHWEFLYHSSDLQTVHTANKMIHCKPSGSDSLWALCGVRRRSS